MHTRTIFDVRKQEKMMMMMFFFECDAGLEKVMSLLIFNTGHVSRHHSHFVSFLAHVSPMKK